MGGVLFPSATLTCFPHLCFSHRLPWFVQLLGRWEVPSGARPNRSHQTPGQDLLGEEAHEEVVCDAEPDVPRAAGSRDPLLRPACVFQTRGCRPGDLLHSRTFWHQGLGRADGDWLISYPTPPRDCLPGFQPLLRHGWGPPQTPGSPDPGGLRKQAVLGLQCGQHDPPGPVGEEVPGERKQTSLQGQQSNSFCLFCLTDWKAAHRRALRLEGKVYLEY